MKPHAPAAPTTFVPPHNTAESVGGPTAQPPVPQGPQGYAPPPYPHVPYGPQQPGFPAPTGHFQGAAPAPWPTNAQRPESHGPAIAFSLLAFLGAWIALGYGAAETQHWAEKLHALDLAVGLAAASVGCGIAGHRRALAATLCIVLGLFALVVTLGLAGSVQVPYNCQ